tara:strand:+ start:258 stop:812 length:555 start_codon:yes stop_codon:yes gene_type:complete
MGLKDDLMTAKLEGLKMSGATPDAILAAKKPGSPLDLQCEMEKEAIVKFMTKADFKITQLKAPIILEDLKTPEQPVNVAVQTLLGEYGPLIDLLKTLATPVPGASVLVDELFGKIKKVVTPLTEGGATLPGLDLNKDDGGLQSTGYVYVGEDPDSQGSFDVDDEDGQRQFTTVKLIREDVEDIL